MRDSGFGAFGYYLLAIIYLIMALCSFIGPAILKRIGTKKCLILGSLGHFTFIVSTILPAWRNEYRQNGINFNKDENKFEKFILSKYSTMGFMIGAAVLNGLGATILWVA
jgi:MFS family permease